MGYMEELRALVGRRCVILNGSVAVVQDAEGRVLLQHRDDGRWGLPGGLMELGESCEDTARRETKEETGLDLEGIPGERVFSYRRDNPEEKDNYFVDVFRFVFDFTEDDIHLQVEETAGCQIAPVEEIHRLGAEGIFLHYQSIKKILPST